MFETDEKFHDALRGEDELGVVIRAHIHIESRLMNLMELFFSAPEHLSKLALEYEQMVMLAVACGLNLEFASPLRVLGKIRNRFAHKLDSSLDKQQVRNLYEAFSPTNKQVIQQAYRNTEDQVAEPTKEKFEDLNAKSQFILLVVALDGMLLVAINDVKSRQSI